MSVNKDRIAALVAAEINSKPPETQEECCDLAARVSVAVRSDGYTDTELIDAAWGGARGLFGPAWDAASEGQRWAWIDMYERALRKAVRDLT